MTEPGGPIGIPALAAPPTTEAPDLRLWLRRFVGALKSGHIWVEDRDDSTLRQLVPRKAQLRLITRMIEMADRGAPIRIIISKARQEGISTFVQDLFVWLCEHLPSYRAITMAHTKEDTDAIFRKAQVCWENLPDERFADVSGTAIKWHHGSEYKARTAGSRGIARGDTFQLMHISELAFCQRVAGMDTRTINAALNSVPFQPHTIVIIESTGDGPSGAFYERCLQAEKGEGPFELLFFAWYEDDGYRLEPPPGWEAPPDVADLGREFRLDQSQLYFYTTKRLESRSTSGSLASGNWEFRREYPSRLMDSFTAASGLVFPDLGSRNIQDLGEPRGLGWEFYRAIDWGWTNDPFVVLFVAHDRSQPPGLIFHPSLEPTVVRDFRAYRMDERTDYPKDKDNHGPDALRMAVIQWDLTGLVYVWKAIYRYNAAVDRLDGMARMIHWESGWHIPPGSAPAAKSWTAVPECRS